MYKTFAHTLKLACQCVCVCVFQRESFQCARKSFLCVRRDLLERQDKVLYNSNVLFHLNMFFFVWFEKYCIHFMLLFWNWYPLALCTQKNDFLSYLKIFVPLYVSHNLSPSLSPLLSPLVSFPCHSPISPSCFSLKCTNVSYWIYVQVLHMCVCVCVYKCLTHTSSTSLPLTLSFPLCSIPAVHKPSHQTDTLLAKWGGKKWNGKICFEQ